MTWAKLKEKIEDHIVAIVLSLVTFLCVVIWQAIPSETWAQVGAAIPKRVLGALIALLLIGLSTALAYIRSLRKTKNQKESQLSQKLSDVEAQIPPLRERIAELASQSDKDQYENRRLEKQVKDLTHDVLDETGQKILELISRNMHYAQDLTKVLKLHPERIEYYLETLEKQGYVRSVRTSFAVPTAYLLEHKGRDFLIKKEVI
jgi:septal ring factor EnvC (AmiA/AmiB activator)